jgi:hypothetical protein
MENQTMKRITFNQIKKGDWLFLKRKKNVDRNLMREIFLRVEGFYYNEGKKETNPTTITRVDEDYIVDKVKQGCGFTKNTAEEFEIYRITEKDYNARFNKYLILGALGIKDIALLKRLALKTKA